jgi:CTP synthase (UTP-ammonia lyase)
MKKENKVKIVLAGKYSDFKDCYLSVIKAAESASWKLGVQIEIVLANPRNLDSTTDPLF